MYKKKALITGITGQDGAYLAKLLLDKGYDVYGLVRRISTPNFWRLEYLGIAGEIKFLSGDLTDKGSLLEAIMKSNPDEIYNLAAQSFVGASFDQPIGSSITNGIGLLNILEIVRNFNQRIKVYQASTSELYGSSVSENMNQNEQTPFVPNSPYAASKLFSFHIARIYREAYGIFVCNGILFNHESPLRGLEFLTRKVTNAVARIKLGLQPEKLQIGNLEAKRDWGYAPEFVESMWRILQHDKPDDYVVATNETHSVREFIEKAFSAAGLDWKEHVEVHDKFKRPVEVDYLKGDYTKAKEIIGWEPKIKFKELVKVMVEEDLRRWQDYKDGKMFAWDAPNHSQNVNYLVRSKDA